MKISIRHKLFLSHFFAILLVSGSIGSFFYTAAIDNLTESLRSRLKYSAAILSHSFDTEELDKILESDEAADQLTDKYLSHIRNLVKSNPDIAFIYVMSLTENEVRFVLDSDTEEPAEMGEIYEEYIPELIQGFKVLSVDKEITTDRWGSFMSGYAPIEGGDTPYMVGIDMYAEEVQNKLSDLRQQGLVSLLLSILFAYTCATFLSRSMLIRIKSLHDRCLDQSSLKDKVIRVQGDELDGLNGAFNYMLESVQSTHEQLEDQVKTRTRELEEANTQLSEEVEERRRMEKVLKESASTDYLTGLLNRREVTNKLKDATTFSKPFSVALLDIDYFKSINDEYGHDTGDDILRKFARTLLHLVKEEDITARWGGEEFIIFMPGMNALQAHSEAERIRTNLKSINFKTPSDLTISASFGVTEHVPGEHWESTIKRADVALYKAKDSGRDRVDTA